MPDISKWDISNVNIMDIDCLFEGCLSLAFYLDINKFNINSKIKNRMFENCINCLIE